MISAKTAVTGRSGTRRRPALIAAATAAAFTVLVTLVIAPVAQAGNDRSADSGTSAEYPAGAQPAMLAEMARTFKITPDQALARLGRETAFARTEESLRKSLGAAFGGAYLDADATTMTVSVTNAALVHRIGATAVTTKLVARSEAQLKGIAAGLDRRAASAPKTTPGWYVDVRTNQVVVSYHAGGLKAARAWVRSGGLDSGAVRYELSTEQPRPMIDIIGGNAYYIGSGTRCSVGFSVNGGFVTAGHCGRTGASTSQPSGTFAGSSFPGNDYGWVRTTAGNTPRPLVNRYPGTVQVNGSRASGVGSSVCRSGSTTGWHCGTILQLNASVTYPEGTIYGLVRTNVCAEPGDSGGSWLTGDQAQGVTSGGSGNCRTGGVIYYQPVNEILQAYGLTLVTGDGNPPPTTPPPTTGPPPTDPPQGCGGLPGWSATTAYGPGDLVSHNGRRYESTWWSTGAEPGADISWAVWKDTGAC